MRVLNKRTDEIPPNAVYVGRPGKWGNPYRIGAPYPGDDTIEMSREVTIDLYKAYINFHSHLIEEAKKELKCKDLVCWCAPLPCHADVLLKIANSE